LTGNHGPGAGFATSATRAGVSTFKIRQQGVLLPEYLDDFVAEENQVRVIEAFVDELDLQGLGFKGVVPKEIRNRTARLGFSATLAE
jgi:hypothetical protein